MATELLACPTCNATLKAVPTGYGFLPHYLCREENYVWARTPSVPDGTKGEWILCEAVQRHVAIELPQAVVR